MNVERSQRLNGLFNLAVGAALLASTSVALTLVHTRTPGARPSSTAAAAVTSATSGTGPSTCTRTRYSPGVTPTTGTVTEGAGAGTDRDHRHLALVILHLRARVPEVGEVARGEFCVGINHGIRILA